MLLFDVCIAQVVMDVLSTAHSSITYYEVRFWATLTFREWAAACNAELVGVQQYDVERILYDEGHKNIFYTQHLLQSCISFVFYVRFVKVR